MSAENWDICPKCKKNAKKEIEETTLREDYEIYIDKQEGTFHIDYSCSCKECGFSYDFEYTEVLNLDE